MARARSGKGPTLLENKTYRIRGHFEGDPQEYRNDEEMTSWKDKLDPINRFTRTLSGKNILNEKKIQKIRDQIAALLQEAVTFAENSPYPEPDDALEDLFANP